MPRLDTLACLFRGRSHVDPTELARYSAAVTPIAERLGALYPRWRLDLEVDSEAEEHANAASIQRWEAAALRDRLAAVEPPPALAKLHADLLAVAGEMARAAQLLSNGYRFHSWRARCDGHALMLASEERFAGLSRALQAAGVRVELGVADTAR